LTIADKSFGKDCIAFQYIHLIRLIVITAFPGQWPVLNSIPRSSPFFSKEQFKVNISDSRVLQLALERLESQRRDIEAEIAALKTRQGGGVRIERRGRPRKHQPVITKVSSSESGSQPKKRMSEQHRQAIALAMKKRWAERNKEKGTGNKGHVDADRTKPRLIKVTRPSE
jgi:hypothetical protein